MPQEDAATQPMEEDAIGGPERIMVTTDQDVPRSFVMYENKRIGAFIKPVLQLSSTLIAYRASRSGEDAEKLSGRTSTLVLARLGVVGKVAGWSSLRLNIQLSRGRTQPSFSAGTPASSSHTPVSIAVLPPPASPRTRSMPVAWKPSLQKSPVATLTR